MRPCELTGGVLPAEVGGPRLEGGNGKGNGGKPKGPFNMPWYKDEESDVGILRPEPSGFCSNSAPNTLKVGCEAAAPAIAAADKFKGKSEACNIDGLRSPSSNSGVVELTRPSSSSSRVSCCPLCVGTCSSCSPPEPNLNAKNLKWDSFQSTRFILDTMLLFVN